MDLLVEEKIKYKEYLEKEKLNFINLHSTNLKLNLGDNKVEENVSNKNLNGSIVIDEYSNKSLYASNIVDNDSVRLNAEIEAVETLEAYSLTEKRKKQPKLIKCNR